MQEDQPKDREIYRKRGIKKNINEIKKDKE